MSSKIEAEVSKMLIDEVAPNFTVKDVNGKTVSLADFKGKTIVLDFWATWCGPCKKSFPAMQMAVNKYKNDPNVKFLFIHTWEKVDQPLADAQSYLNSNNYKFDLYMDTKDPKTKTNPAVSAFDVKGIPAKFVIDGKGKTRFKITGFSGGDDAAVAELSSMIDLIKKSS
ncbi:TlpA family protein disulfide reductase [Pedobacter hiemivivus]|uniref:TlpA family protein disulfide reductase n=1 Tax=Pedobacter hiemivivus TaxID=2530454 RepID=A0A4U1G473_9SPHI|nr:TlpA disulfide reductase family protein [Pedobacter hiemivivus]TKC57173.1 TlpA family protein disulfide reductase [Pedobacter hiemivivus]